MIKASDGGPLTGQLMRKRAELCENLCEKNFPKSAKINKNLKRCGKSYLTNSVAYNNLRRLGNSEVVTENPRVGSSILSLGTMISGTYEIFVGAFFVQIGPKKGTIQIIHNFNDLKSH